MSEETRYYCPHCGESVRSGNQFCVHCGRPLPKHVANPLDMAASVRDADFLHNEIDTSGMLKGVLLNEMQAESISAGPQRLDWVHSQQKATFFCLLGFIVLYASYKVFKLDMFYQFLYHFDSSFICHWVFLVFIGLCIALLVTIKTNQSKGMGLAFGGLMILRLYFFFVDILNDANVQDMLGHFDLETIGVVLVAGVRIAYCLLLTAIYFCQLSEEGSKKLWPYIRVMAFFSCGLYFLEHTMYLFNHLTQGGNIGIFVEYLWWNSTYVLTVAFYHYLNQWWKADIKKWNSFDIETKGANAKCIKGGLYK